MDNRLITIIGGSGFLGRYLVQHACVAGYRVRVAVRNPQNAIFLKTLGRVGQVQLMQANVRNLESIEAAVAGADSVVNLVGLLSESGRQKFKKVHDEGADHIARAAAAAGAHSLVHVSAIGADQGSRSLYARTKAEGEEKVRAAFPNATIVRPSVVFGPEDGFFNRFAAMAKWPMPFMPLIAGDMRLQPVYVCDVARALLEIIEDDRHAGQVYEVGGPQIYTMRELLQYILREVQVRKPLLEVPMGVARVQAFFLGLAPKPLLTSDQLKLLALDNVVSEGAKTLEDCDVIATPMEAIVPNYLARYRSKGRLNKNVTA